MVLVRLPSQGHLALARFGKWPPNGAATPHAPAGHAGLFRQLHESLQASRRLALPGRERGRHRRGVPARSLVGKLLPDDLYVHRSALDALEPLLRIYEGCGRAYLGDVEGANVIKIHRRSGKLSYLVYPEFDDDPHPALLRSIRVSLRTRRIDGTDYAQSANPPVLHRKESFLAPDHPLYAKFARLTACEEKNGLLDNPSGIGTRVGWSRRLAERGFSLKGHRLVRSNGQRNGPRGS